MAKDRTGQQVTICQEPLMVYEVTGWDEARGVWAATCIHPTPKLVPLVFREDLLQYLDDQKQPNDTGDKSDA